MADRLLDSRIFPGQGFLACRSIRAGLLSGIFCRTFSFIAGVFRVFLFPFFMVLGLLLVAQEGKDSVQRRIGKALGDQRDQNTQEDHRDCRDRDDRQHTGPLFCLF